MCLSWSVILHGAAIQANWIYYINTTAENICFSGWKYWLEVLNKTMQHDLMCPIWLRWDSADDKHLLLNGHVWLFSSASMICIQHDFRECISDDTNSMNTHMQSKKHEQIMSECSTEIYRVFVIGMCTCSSILIKMTAARNQNDLWNKKSLRFNQIDSLPPGSKLMLISMMTDSCCMGSNVWMNRSCDITKNRRNKAYCYIGLENSSCSV